MLATVAARAIATRSLSTSAVAAAAAAGAQAAAALDPVQKFYIGKLRDYQKQKDTQANADVPLSAAAQKRYQDLMGRSLRQFNLQDAVKIPALTSAPSLSKIPAPEKF
ncbi:hypothetical protein CAOG_04461 [Capsaspora owczarzaki ATCC 30864]|uniref:Uncharacterized protein n=1 Tax=Capsaspora owczarzaki (strain ATCC 30864) TaxID=595528 RepID=A0A0D2VRX5_CAPO3|nr:hypothetical protein CAOG_04461 [Capsaspora owczarzaki ATCC 30864]KJE93707.1 hypothetical protein CAOG_004461 [Capsaspora owczarzaki ATCC 30864]|eukprot:XP_004348289.1 hypothetical protein CAOG_04461 [Capsaspora owczarzaki ATCC 30864]